MDIIVGIVVVTGVGFVIYKIKSKKTFKEIVASGRGLITKLK